MVEIDIRKILGIAVLSLLIGFAAYSLAQTANETASINNVFEIVVNNTNLAPSIHGVPGTGERVQGETYYANNSPVQILVFAHAQNVSQTAFVELSINGTIVLPQSGRPLGSAEQSNRSISAIIPKFASYKVDIENDHHYEWREYPILSGKNGTLTTGSVNSFDEIFVNKIHLNNSLIAANPTYTYFYSGDQNSFVRIENQSIRIKSANIGGEFGEVYVSPFDAYLLISTNAITNQIEPTGSGVTIYSSTITDTHNFLVSPTGLTSDKLAGTGNAFLCVDSAGNFYRSGVACV